MIEKLHLQVRARVQAVGTLLAASLLGVLAPSCSSDSTDTGGQTGSSTSSSGSDGGTSSSGATSSGATSSGATSSGATSSGATGEIWGCVEAGGSCICQPTDKTHESTCTGTYKCCFAIPFAGTTRCQCQDPGTSKCEDLASVTSGGKVVAKCPPP